MFTHMAWFFVVMYVDRCHITVRLLPCDTKISDGRVKFMRQPCNASMWLRMGFFNIFCQNVMCPRFYHATGVLGCHANKIFYMTTSNTYHMWFRSSCNFYQHTWQSKSHVIGVLGCHVTFLFAWQPKRPIACDIYCHVFYS